MRKLLIIAGLLILLPCVVFGASTYEKITVADTAIGFTAATIAKYGPAGADASALCYVSTAAIMYLTTGSAPTATDGMPVSAGSYVRISKFSRMTNFLAIRSGGVSAVLYCIYDDE